MCALHLKEAKQTAMGQSPIDEIDFFLFLGDVDRRGRGLSSFSSAVKLIGSMKSNERRP